LAEDFAAFRRRRLQIEIAGTQGLESLVQQQADGAQEHDLDPKRRHDPVAFGELGEVVSWPGIARVGVREGPKDQLLHSRQVFKGMAAPQRGLAPTRSVAATPRHARTIVRSVGRPTLVLRRSAFATITRPMRASIRAPGERHGTSAA
jgi:hypothetical protein